MELNVRKLETILNSLRSQGMLDDEFRVWPHHDGIFLAGDVDGVRREYIVDADISAVFMLQPIEWKMRIHDGT